METEKNVVELEIYLIRHGQSNANAGINVRETPTIQDMADPYLTEIGISQAKALGEHLSDINFDAVYSSGLFRAERTATEVINAQKNRCPYNKECNDENSGKYKNYIDVKGDPCIYNVTQHIRRIK